jgi:hypothetical protein
MKEVQRKVLWQIIVRRELLLIDEVQIAPLICLDFLARYIVTVKPAQPEPQRYGHR